uniref:Uncharacterized protein n=1 Tax=Arundo donax TaxID=35708 RepID=A0A0A9G1V0_ARUDO
MQNRLHNRVAAFVKLIVIANQTWRTTLEARYSN